jgi:hypothetical protein
VGYELIVNDKGEQFVTESRERDNTVEVLFIHRNEEDDDLEEWIADREHVSERVRQTADVLMAVRELRELIGADQTVDDDISGDGRIRAVLDTASRQLLKLADDFDSANFGHQP